jgi:hypothetical protein
MVSVSQSSKSFGSAFGSWSGSRCHWMNARAAGQWASQAGQSSIQTPVISGPCQCSRRSVPQREHGWAGCVFVLVEVEPGECFVADVVEAAVDVADAGEGVSAR